MAVIGQQQAYYRRTAGRRTERKDQGVKETGTVTEEKEPAKEPVVPDVKVKEIDVPDKPEPVTPEQKEDQAEKQQKGGGRQATLF